MEALDGNCLRLEGVLCGQEMKQAQAVARGSREEAAQRRSGSFDGWLTRPQLEPEQAQPKQAQPTQPQPQPSALARGSGDPPGKGVRSRVHGSASAPSRGSGDPPRKGGMSRVQGQGLGFAPLLGCGDPPGKGGQFRVQDFFGGKASYMEILCNQEEVLKTDLEIPWTLTINVNHNQHASSS